MFLANHPKKIFDEQLDTELGRSIYRQVLLGWGASSVEMADSAYPDDIVRYIFPQTLRAKVDMFLLGIPGLSSGLPDVLANLTPNDGGGTHHTLIRLPFGMMTASAVRTVNSVVRPAGFRNQYVRLQSRFVIDSISNQLILAKGLAPDDAKVYAIILHGPRIGDRYRNGFVHIVFLDADGIYLEERIKLEEQYPDVLRELEGSEDVQDTAQVQARTIHQNSNPSALP